MSRGELGMSLCERSSAADTAAEFARLRGRGRRRAGSVGVAARSYPAAYGASYWPLSGSARK